MAKSPFRAIWILATPRSTRDSYQERHDPHNIIHLPLFSSTMAVSKKTLRFKLDAAFNAIFPEGDDIPAYLRHLNSSKKTKNSAQNGNLSVVSREGGGHWQRDVGGDGSDDNNDHDDLPAPSYVKGQSIFGALDAFFANGDEVNLEHYLHSFVKSPAEKQRAVKMRPTPGCRSRTMVVNLSFLNLFQVCRPKRTGDGPAIHGGCFPKYFQQVLGGDEACCLLRLCHF
jgi:hypothetical protein